MPVQSCIFYLKIHYSHMDKDEALKLTDHFLSMTGSYLKKYVILNIKIMEAFFFSKSVILE